MGDLDRYQGLAVALLPRAEIDALLQAMVEARGVDAAVFTKLRNRVVAAHLKFAASIARRHRCALDLDERIQLAALGMMRAADTFDITRGISFVTYGAFWIRATIQRAIANTSSTIRLPVKLRAQLRKVRRAVAKHGAAPTVDELVALTGLSVDVVTRALEANTAAPRSWNAPAGDDEDGATFGDLIADDGESAEDAAVRGENIAMVTKAMTSLSTKERDVIQGRFWRDQTLAEMGDAIGRTRETIRLRERAALETLRALVR